MSNSESILNKFVEKIDFTKLEGTPEGFYKAGLAFVRNGEFDSGIIEFVKIIKTVPHQEPLFANAVKELESMGFSDADVYAIYGILETKENSNATLISTSAQSSAAQTTHEPSSKAPAEKKCPYCAETIKYEAIVCRFCGRDLNRITPLKENSKVPEKKKKRLWLSVIGVIVGCCMLLVVYGIIKDLFISPLMNVNTYATSTATYRTVPDLSGCLRWSKLTPQMKGKTVCVYGKIYYHLSNYELKKTFLYFGNTNQPYITSSDGWSQSLNDVCIQTEGIVQIDSSQTPYINIGGDEVYTCLSWMK